MRLITWNTNHNCHRQRSFVDIIALIETLRADIMVLSECPRPVNEDPRQVQWIGGGVPGLAVVARGAFDLTAHPAAAAVIASGGYGRNSCKSFFSPAGTSHAAKSARSMMTGIRS